MDDQDLIQTIAASVKHPAVNLQLDWRGYFLLFCEQHGGNPIHHGGRLLFADGSTYSSTDYAGPEWAPPTDPEELRLLQRTYWLRRRAIVVNEAAELRQAIIGLQQMQSIRTTPLQAQSSHLDPETNKWVVTRGDLDLTQMKGRLEWLESDVLVCAENLRDLEEVTDGARIQT